MSWRFESDDFPLQMGVFLGSQCRAVSALRGTGRSNQVPGFQRDPYD